MQEKTEGAMVENNFVWDVTRYKWTCSSLKDKPTWLSALAVAAMIMYLLINVLEESNTRRRRCSKCFFDKCHEQALLPLKHCILSL